MQNAAFALMEKNQTLGHILIVEDNAPNALVISTLLELLGYSFDIVTSGEEAVRVANANNYAAIFMDMMLPGINGIETAKNIRRMERKHKISPVPIIGMTASSCSEEKAACHIVGMNDYLEKPFQSEKLKQVLDTHCTVANAKIKNFIS